MNLEYELVSKVYWYTHDRLTLLFLPKFEDRIYETENDSKERDRAANKSWAQCIKVPLALHLSNPTQFPL